jgi:23S rRNA (uracil1939-C5)-methyltransferase
VPEPPLVLDVERLTFGFDALAHHGRQVVFVPYAAPGDRVAADVVERRPGYLRARVSAVLAPGPARTPPACPHFATCGGCQWQHVAADAQREAKRAIVAEQLARVAGLRDAEVRPTLPSPRDLGYRARVSLVVEGRRAGYHRARSHALVEVDACPLAEAVVSDHLGAARAWIAALRAPVRRVTVSAAPGGVALAAVAAARPGPADQAASEALLVRTASVRGTVLTGAGARQVAGDPSVRVELEPGLAVEVPADAFTQVNPEANRLLVATVLELGAFRAGERVLDLYCGAGNRARSRAAASPSPASSATASRSRRRSERRASRLAATFGAPRRGRARACAPARRRGRPRSAARARATPRGAGTAPRAAHRLRLLRSGDAGARRARARRVRLSPRARAADRLLPADVSRRERGGTPLDLTGAGPLCSPRGARCETHRARWRSVADGEAR